MSVNVRKVDELKDKTIQKRLQKVFGSMQSLISALWHVLGNSYTLKFQVRDASVPDRILWEKEGRLAFDSDRQTIYPTLEGLPITITQEDLLKAFRSKLEVKELLVFVCWEFQIGDFKTLLPVQWPIREELIIVTKETPITLS